MQQDIFNQIADIIKPEPMEQKPILAHLEKKAQTAHNWLSFSPEKRGTQMIKDYSEELESDINELKAQDITEEKINDYKNRYETLFSSYLSAKGICFSTMITGGSGVNLRKHEKTKRSEERHYEIFREWRERAKKAIVRKSKPQTTYLSELDRYKSQLEGMKKNHELMKQANKMISKARKENKDISQDIMTLIGCSKFDADWAIKYNGFGLANNNASMKRVEEMIKLIEKKEELKNNDEAKKEYFFEGGILKLNYEIDRIQIIFDTKPNWETLNKWKQNGLNSYNYSPSNNAWQRKITPNAIYSVKQLFKRLEISLK
jgi:hypothetical protein